MELTSELAEELVHRGYESPDLDYKEKFDNSTGSWMEVAKDVYGMANHGGGYIVFGVQDATFKPIGMDQSFHIDSQTWADKFSKWIDGKINLTYLEYAGKVDGNAVKFPILYIHGSVSSLAIPKTDGIYNLPSGQPTIAFNRGIIYTRENTSTVSATGGEFWKLFVSLTKRTAQTTGSEGTPLEVISVLNRKAQPDVIEETLWFNLFPITELPDFIHVASTESRSPKDVYDHIREEFAKQGITKYDIPSFLLSDKKIYSFSPFDDMNPLTFCTDTQFPAIPTQEWLVDETKHQNLIKLLNYNLKDLCRKKRFYHDVKRDRYFIRYFDGPVPEITWKPYKSTSTRKLVFIRLSKEGNLLYCEHFGARMRFIILGGGIYLTIEPIRVLTEDGSNPLDQRWNTRISTKKNSWYHNNNYLYDVKLMLHILAGNREEIHFGNGQGRITVSILSINSKTNFGILNDLHAGGDFLDSLKSEPLEYQISYNDSQDDNPLTETSMEE
ncbi:MAG: ATP-binding protein [Candidatus Nitrosotenuis sp.]|nr:MAG: ATP-binding protein [Candidatus Nitrosotenuis sp.]